MRAGASARIIAIAPIDQIVPAFLPLSGMIGNFIGGQAGGFGQFLGGLIKPCRQVFIGSPQLAVAMQEGIRRFRLDGQLIERQMIGAEGQGLFQLAVPLRIGLIGPGINQIQ